jgi:hypothetical protein
MRPLRSAWLAHEQREGDHGRHRPVVLDQRLPALQVEPGLARIGEHEHVGPGLAVLRHEAEPLAVALLRGVTDGASQGGMGRHGWAPAEPAGQARTIEGPPKRLAPGVTLTDLQVSTW